MDHEGGGSVLPFVVLALALGAAIRHCLRKTRLPYTVALLLLGLLLGLLNRFHWLHENWPELGQSLQAASVIDPHLILFVFLPTLIFESAFSLDTHIFRRCLSQVFLLAVPGLLLSTVAVGWFAIYFFPWSWDWKTAIMFGAIISATDPVAVVAILRELGAGKQLATIIEGESLLNDGTAIVIFLVFFQAMASGQDIGSASNVMGEFARVSMLGPVVGGLIAVGTILWIRHVFNDALVEITVTIVAAYLTYFLAENVLHVSGVLAVVALGLAMSGYGRTSVSPEVEGFLHRFWEMMAYLLNTLIFIIVGLVVATNAPLRDPVFWLTLFGLYIGIHIVRALLVFIFYKPLKVLGYGMTWKEGLVIWWGGLRGAVGLSLALVVAGNSVIPEDIRGQILSLSAGIVVLTLVINGTTIRTLIHFLGMDVVLPARIHMLSSAARQVHADTEATLKLLKRDRFLCGADWEIVRTYLPDISLPMNPGQETCQIDLAAEARRRILEAEKKSYWRQYHEGLLGADTVRHLVESVDLALDKNASLDERSELQKLWEYSPFIKRLKTQPTFGRIFKYLFYHRLAFSYDVARGFVFAQDEIAGMVEGMIENEQLATLIKKESENNRLMALKALTNLRDTFPEVTVAIETKTAVRSVLNHERSALHKMQRDGILEEGETRRLVDEIETRMKQVVDEPPAIKLPEPNQLLKEITWLEKLDKPTFDRVLSATSDRLYTMGEYLIKENSPSDSLCVIARGTVRVYKSTKEGEQFLDLMGPGSVIGEMGVLTGSKRSASVKAESPVNALWIMAKDLHKIMKDSSELNHKLWQTAGARFAENFLIRKKPYNHWGQLRLRRWLLDGTLEEPEDGKLQKLKGHCVLLAGEAVNSENGVVIITPPAVLDPCTLTFRNNAKIFRCPPIDNSGPMD